MNLKQNIGIANALIRITIGLTVVAFSTAKLTRRPWKNSYLLLAMLGAMKVGEGILRYCPITAMFENGSMGSFMGKGEGKDAGYRSQGHDGQQQNQKHESSHAGGGAGSSMGPGLDAVMKSFQNELGEDAPKVSRSNQQGESQDEFSPEVEAVVKSFEKKVDESVSKNGNGGQPNH
ncbi:DUF2892 family protein [Falsibacillus pallidus]|uniref:DUF2892 family protein n=1 Tax=Falsibacillus pallidus TaxID=493781 RepID=A0A370G126_9BACI|nr:DUF2892 family protein [Falsibacillus pallidus]